MQDLEGKVAFITGGASGIGLGMAKAFLKRGMKVAIADINTKRLVNAEKALDSPGNLIALELDVTDRSAIERAADRTEEAFDKVHVVCNNAGVGGGGPAHKTPIEVWNRILDINLNGIFHGVQVFLPRILKHGEGGHIVNSASTAGLQPNANQGVYCTSKYAIVGFTEALHKDLAEEKDVSVSVLCPWFVDTPILYGGLDDDDLEGIEKRREAIGEWYKEAVSPDLVGEQVVEGILKDELFIFCDGGWTRKLIEERTKRVFDALDRQFPQ
jgi:NAD(P)-dependent dehydrogenase (short-subunit alcohol dehydrogenase family)